MKRPASNLRLAVIAFISTWPGRYASSTVAKVSLQIGDSISHGIDTPVEEWHSQVLNTLKDDHELLHQTA